MLAWPALAMLRASLPEARIEVLVPEYTRAVALLCPSVDEVVLDPGPGAGAGALAALLRARQYDALLTLFSTTRVGWAGLRARIPLRLAPATKLAQTFYNHRVVQRRSRSEKPEFEYNSDLARALLRDLGAEPVEVEPPYLCFDADEQARVEQALRAELGVASGERLVFLHAGSGGSANNLSLEQYAELAAALRSDRGHVLVLTAGPGEREQVELLSARLGAATRHVILESSEGLETFARWVALADVFIAGSTGTLHLAGALDVPTAGFYPRRRSSTPLRWQTLNRPERRLAWCPADDAAERDLSKIDVRRAALEIGERFLGA